MVCEAANRASFGQNPPFVKCEIKFKIENFAKSKFGLTSRDIKFEIDSFVKVKFGFNKTAKLNLKLTILRKPNLTLTICVNLCLK